MTSYWIPRNKAEAGRSNQLQGRAAMQLRLGSENLYVQLLTSSLDLISRREAMQVRLTSHSSPSSQVEVTKAGNTMVDLLRLWMC